MGTAIRPEEGTFNGCFGCGSENPRGLRLVFERDGDCVVGRGHVGSEYAGYRDFVHGGIVATLLDEAMGWALLEITGRYGVTRALRVDYRRPVAHGKAVVVRGQVVRVEGRNITLAASLADDRDRVLATAQGEWVTVRRDRAAGATARNGER